MADKNNIPQFVNSNSFMADKNYVKWVSDLKKRFRMAQLKAAVKVNTEMLKFYWSLGEDICEKQKQYKWGAKYGHENEMYNVGVEVKEGECL